jgi:hypothetical protein
MAVKPIVDLVGNNSGKPVNRSLLSTLALILGIQLLGFSYFLWFLSQHGYLPSPFFYYKHEVLMDLFRPLYWSDNGGAYTEWKSFYPPLNFLFLKFIKQIFLGSAVFSDSFALRASAFPVVLFFIFSYLISPILVLRTRLWSCFSNAEKTLLYFIIVLSTPMLFELERGNLIIYTLFFIPFVLSSTGVLRMFCIAVLINLKPYLALLLIYYFARRNWKEFWLCTLITGTLFVITGILQDPNYWLIFPNMFNFSQIGASLSLKEVMAMPSSIAAYSYVFNNELIQHTKYGYIFNLHAFANVIYAINWFVLAWVVAAIYNKQNQLNDAQIFAILLVVVSNLGVWVGGWSLIFYVTLLPVFLTMRLRKIYFLILVLLFVPLDFIPLVKVTIGEQYSYLTDSIVVVHWTLGMGSVLKPILNFILMATLLYEISQLKHQRATNDHQNNDVLQNLK